MGVRLVDGTEPVEIGVGLVDGTEPVETVTAEESRFKTTLGALKWNPAALKLKFPSELLIDVVANPTLPSS